MSNVQTTRHEQKGRPKSVKKPYKQETTIRPKIWTAGDTSTGQRHSGATTYNKTDGEGPAGEESVGQPPSRTMTHWSDTVTSRRYTVHFSGESGEVAISVLEKH